MYILVEIQIKQKIIKRTKEMVNEIIFNWFLFLYY